MGKDVSANKCQDQGIERKKRGAEASFLLSGVVLMLDTIRLEAISVLVLQWRVLPFPL